jgi:hypothetical protein
LLKLVAAIRTTSSGANVQFVFGTTGAGMAEIQNAMVVVKLPKWIYLQFALNI